MNLSTKILVFATVVLVLVLGTFIVVKQFEISKREEAIEKHLVQQKDLLDNIQRSQAQWATKQDLEVFAKNNNVNLDVVKKDLDKLHADLVGINVATAHSTKQETPNHASDSVTPGPDAPGPSTVACNGNTVSCPDPFGYMKNTQHLNLNEKFSNVTVPFGKVSFSAWREKPWDVTVNDRTYKMVTVLGKDENGKEYAYNKLSIQTGDQNYDVKLSESKFLQQYPESHFSFWNPRLFLGVDVGANLQEHQADVVANVGLGVMSYGQFKYQPSWVFLTGNLGYATQSRKASVSLTPAMYNIGQHIPLTKNIYVGPTLGVDTSANYYLLGGIHVGL